MNRTTKTGTSWRRLLRDRRRPAVRKGLFILLSMLTLTICSPLWSPDLFSSSAVAQSDDDATAETNTTSDSGDNKKPPKKALTWLVESLGLLYIAVFLMLSFSFVALFVMNLLMARRDNICPVSLIEGFEAHLNEKHYQEAYEMAKADESFLGNVLSAGLAKLSSGYEHAIEAMQEVGEEENMKLDHRLSYIALIGTISPMIGLFGTVHGMIDSFYEIAVGGSTPDPSRLADGISKALLTTLIGLAIAIPAVATYNIFRNRIQRLVLEVGIMSEGLMSRFENVGESKS